ncbi:MAG: carotenoid biosynthesis protein [Chitinophagales bacterium]
MISFLRNNVFKIFVFNIIVIYIVGVCGICCTNGKQQLLFLKLTPINLIVTTFFTFIFHKNWNLKFISTLFFIFLFGFFIEVLGVKTQVVFGSYYYGKTLGFKVFDVPLTMGLNWLLLIYCIAVSFNKISNLFLFSFIAAATMTLLDLLIEPIAIKLDFWQWQNNIAPLQNYIAWFILSFVLFLFFRIINKKPENNFAKVVLVIQFLFFGILNFLLR